MIRDGSFRRFSDLGLVTPTGLMPRQIVDAPMAVEPIRRPGDFPLTSRGWARASPMTQITVRKAEAADAPAIQALYRQLVSNPAVSVTPERIANLAADPATALLVAEIGGRVAGTVLVSLCADVMFGDQPFAVIENVVVSGEHRGLGIGEALMCHAERHCQVTGCSKIMLLSSAERTEAHRFFERAGFTSSTKKGFVKYRRQFSSPT